MSLREVMSKCRPFFVYLAIFGLIDSLLSLAPSIYMLQVFDRVLSSRSLETLAVITAIFVFALAIEGVVDSLRSRLFLRLGDTVYAALRTPVLNAVLRFRKQGQIYTHGLEDLNVIKGFLSGAGIKAFMDIPWIPMYFLVLWLFHPLLSVIAMGSALVLFGLTYLEEIITKKNETLASQKMRESGDYIMRSFQNAEAVVALAMQGNVQARWRKVNDDYLRESSLARKKVSAIMGLSKFVRNTLQVAAMGMAAFLVMSVEGVSPGVMIASTIIMGKAVAPIVTVLNSWRSFVNFRTAYARLDEMLKEGSASQEGFRHPPPQGVLSVESLLFFLSRDRTILNGIGFKLEAGEVLGVIGSSASGKTSLARLLVGIYQPSDGTVRLDGVDMYQWCRNGLGDHIGYLPQEPQLFAGTVAENIARLGDAYAQSDAVIEAAQRAHVHDIILRLPKGYDTELGHGGTPLSGGQKQLIGLARALFRRPRFVVLDEPNANLDGQSELILVDVLRELRAEGVTVVIISHKPSILQDVDKLLVLSGGKQLMFGPRAEIMQRLGQTHGVVAAGKPLAAVGSAG